jgi:hypothetical protein
MTILALFTALSFMLTHDYDDKWSLPLLIWAVMALLAAPVGQQLLALLVLVSWFSLWLIAFVPRLQTSIYFLFSMISLWLLIIWVADQRITEPLTYERAWFWIPAAVFVISSLWLAYYLLTTKKTEQDYPTSKFPDN